jgi:hypothetical protein
MAQVVPCYMTGPAYKQLMLVTHEQDSTSEGTSDGGQHMHVRRC